MNILLLGSGGREHAIAQKILQSHHTTKLYVAPGNAGIAEVAEIVSLNPVDSEAVVNFSHTHSIDLIVIGPEAPLVAGVVDQLRRAGFKVFGPNASAAQLEASKAFTKNLLQKNKIPTAAFETFQELSLAKKSLTHRKFPLVVKADGLAAGKGVLICQNQAEAVEALEEIFEKKSFGDQHQVVIEDFLIGEEASFMVLCDGKNFLSLATSQDHKRLLDNDEGPNTGGMGAYSPAPVVNENVYQKTIEQVIRPTLAGLASDQIDYRGVLYAGLMIHEENPSVLEYNVRFGDPECEVILPRLKSDFVELMMASVDGALDQHPIEWDRRFAVCVVLAAEGYPQAPKKGEIIEGIEEAAKLKDVFVFHAGTVKKEGKWFTQGGRVLIVTALGDSLQCAIDNVYQAVSKIHFRGMQFRKDIGKKGLRI